MAEPQLVITNGPFTRARSPTKSQFWSQLSWDIASLSALNGDDKAQSTISPTRLIAIPWLLRIRFNWSRLWQLLLVLVVVPSVSWQAVYLSTWQCPVEANFIKCSQLQLARVLFLLLLLSCLFVFRLVWDVYISIGITQSISVEKQIKMFVAVIVLEKFQMGVASVICVTNGLFSLGLGPNSFQLTSKQLARW